VHGIIALANPICRYAMEIAPSCVYGLTLSHLLPDLTIQNLVSLLDDSRSPILFRCEEFSAPPPCSGAASTESPSQRTKAIPSELRLLILSENLHALYCPSIFNHSPSVEVLLGSVHSCLQQPRLFLLLRLTLRLNLDLRSPAHSNNLTQLWGKRVTKAHYLTASTHSMRRFSTALDAGISQLKQRNN
jgi:hypothetical protein